MLEGEELIRRGEWTLDVADIEQAGGGGGIRGVEIVRNVGESHIRTALRQRRQIPIRP